MKNVDIQDAQANLPDWVGLVAGGGEIVITDGGVPVAKLVACGRQPGVWAGKVHIAEDFDELPEDIARAFEGEGD